MAGPSMQTSEQDLRIQCYRCGCNRVTEANSKFECYPRRDLTEVTADQRIVVFYGMTTDCHSRYCLGKLSVFARQERMAEMVEFTRESLIRVMKTYLSIGANYHKIPLRSRAGVADVDQYSLAHEQFGIRRTPWRQDPFFSDYVEGRSLLGKAKDLCMYEFANIWECQQAMEWTCLAEFLRVRMDYAIKDLGRIVHDMAMFSQGRRTRRTKTHVRGGVGKRAKTLPSPLSKAVRIDAHVLGSAAILQMKRDELRGPKEGPIADVSAVADTELKEEVWSKELLRAWERRMALCKRKHRRGRGRS